MSTMTIYIGPTDPESMHRTRVSVCRQAIREDWPSRYHIAGEGARQVAESAAWVWSDGAAWDHYSPEVQDEWMSAAMEALTP